jgi:hypothetical protein
LRFVKLTYKVFFAGFVKIKNLIFFHKKVLTDRHFFGIIKAQTREENTKMTETINEMMMYGATIDDLCRECGVAPEELFGEEEED